MNIYEKAAICGLACGAALGLATAFLIFRPSAGGGDLPVASYAFAAFAVIPLLGALRGAARAAAAPRRAAAAGAPAGPAAGGYFAQ